MQLGNEPETMNLITVEHHIWAHHTGGPGGRTILTKSILQTDHSLQSVAGDDFKHKLHCASESLLSELDRGSQLIFL